MLKLSATVAEGRDCGIEGDEAQLCAGITHCNQRDRERWMRFKLVVYSDEKVWICGDSLPEIESGPDGSGVGRGEIGI